MLRMLSSVRYCASYIDYYRRFIVKKQRPVNLDLTTIKLPSAGKASILHRVTGVGMFVAMVFVIWAWATSLQSPESFQYVTEVMQGIVGYIFTLGTLSLLLYHFIGGVRHVIMDMGHWEELDSGNTSANVAIGLWIVLTIVVGVVLW
jgi:succinate dehydrogenase / fumarate reductase cytochrome b subunit